MTREELIESLVEEEGEEYFEREQLESMSPRDLLNTWLTWQGIQGFTDDILEACQALHLPDRADRGILYPEPDLKGKLVLQMYTSGKWARVAYAENTAEGLAWLEEMYGDFDNPNMTIELFT